MESPELSSGHEAFCEYSGNAQRDVTVTHSNEAQLHKQLIQHSREERGRQTAAGRFLLLLLLLQREISDTDRHISAGVSAVGNYFSFNSEGKKKKEKTLQVSRAEPLVRY